MKNTVDITNYNQVRNLAFSLGITNDQLTAAVAKVGPKIEDIRTYLKISPRNAYVNRTAPGRWRL